MKPGWRPSLALIEQTREHFADIGRKCIEEALHGDIRVNDLGGYIAWQRQCIRDDLGGKSDHTFTFLQRAYWLETGECVPLLAPSIPQEEAAR